MEHIFLLSAMGIGLIIALIHLFYNTFRYGDRRDKNRLLSTFGILIVSILIMSVLGLQSLNSLAILLCCLGSIMYINLFRSN